MRRTTCRNGSSGAVCTGTRLVAAGAAALVFTGCTAGGAAAPTSSDTTRTLTHTLIAPPSTGPVDTGPTRTTTAASCPLLPQQSAADDVGMRLDRTTVLTSAGRTVGCRLYALQGSSLTASEHLPGPKQPAVEIISRRYASARAAHNAFVRLAEQGTNPQQDRIGRGGIGVCFQTDFYPRDDGTDWACAFSIGRTAVLVRTVVTSPALNAVLVARFVAARF